MARDCQRRPLTARYGQSQPEKAIDGQRQPEAARDGQKRPEMAIDGQRWPQSWILFRLMIMSAYMAANVLVRPRAEAANVHEQNKKMQKSRKN